MFSNTKKSGSGLSTGAIAGTAAAAVGLLCRGDAQTRAADTRPDWPGPGRHRASGGLFEKAGDPAARGSAFHPGPRPTAPSPVRTGAARPRRRASRRVQADSALWRIDLIPLYAASEDGSAAVRSYAQATAPWIALLMFATYWHMTGPALKSPHADSPVCCCMSRRGVRDRTCMC